MELDLQYWLDETGAQGDPSAYRKADLEMWVLGIFNSHKFHSAGFSRSQKRRSFNEVWDAAKGDSLAIAYGFNEALRRQSYSIGYVVACARNMAVNPPKTTVKPPLAAQIPQNVPPKGYETAVKIPRPVKEEPPPKAKKAVKIKVEEPKKVTVDWS